MNLYCCACRHHVTARLTDGREAYPHRPDLAELPFWKCDGCGNFVGCHHKRLSNPTKPLGNIPTPELKVARQHIHAILDPLWQSGQYGRGELYRAISKTVGWQYHTAKIRTIEEDREIYRIVRDMRKQREAALPRSPGGDT